jgi:hypothetical protein
MNILQAEDCVNGREGIATAEINGEIIELMELSNITITIEKTKTEFKAIGTRNTQNKTTGWKGTGSANVRYVSSRWAKLMENYVKTGKDTYFTIVVTNEDPGSATGKQVIQVLGCNLDSLDIAKLDIDTEILDQDVNFTFNDFNVLEEFNTLA